MNNLKFLSLLLFFLLNSLVVAREWKVQEKKSEFFAVSGDGYKVALTPMGGEPKLIKETAIGDHFIVLIYNAGDTGTSTFVTHHRGVVFSKREMKILGDFPYAYISSSYEIDQPKWKVNGKKLVIKDEEEGISKTLVIK
jgi:hypothetical protein